MAISPKMDSTEFKQAVLTSINKVAAQGQLGRDGKGHCHYTREDENGKEICCLVGHMMPDTETRASAENYLGGGGAIYYLFKKGFPWAQQFSAFQLAILVKMQLIHDATDDTDTNTFEASANEKLRPLLDKE